MHYFIKTVHYKFKRMRLTCFTEKCNTSFMYFGRSLIIVYPPQSNPISAATKAQIAGVNNNSLHGVGAKSWEIN